MNAQVLDNVDTGPDLERGASQPVANDQSPAETAPAATQNPGDGAIPSGDSQTPAASRQQRTDTVPHAALHETREQLKEARRQIAALEAQPRLTAEDAELLKNLRQRQQQPQEPADPDFLQDPKGYVDTKLTRALKKLEAAETTANETRQQLEQRNQVAEMMGVVQAHERTFVASTPDYNQALAHLRNIRTQQLQLLYPQATAAQIHQQISREELAGAHQALQAGQNPAEVVYKYAQTLGYKPAQSTPAATPTPTPPVDRSAARTLGSGGGGSPSSDASETEDPLPEFTAALKERFGVARRR